MRRRRNTVTRAGLVLLAVALIAALVLPVAGTAFGATEDGDDAAPAPSAGAPVVLLGTGGLRWEDLSALATPQLWALAEDGGVANSVVRSVRSSTCPADGWLAVSAGRRAADLPAATSGVCRRLEDAADGVVPGWPDYLSAAADASYDARPGTLGDLLSGAGVAAAAVGPGAAIALANPDGAVVGEYAPRPEDPAQLGGLLEQLAPEAGLLVVDLGAVRDRDHPLLPATDRRFSGPEDDAPEKATSDWPLAGLDRTEQVAVVEARAAAVVDALPAGATVLLASLADSGTTPVMQVTALAAQDEPAGMLESRSTRQPGMIQSTDLLPTLLDRLAIDAPAGLAGAPVRVVLGEGSGAGRIATLIDENRHAMAVRPLTAPFFSGLVLVNLGLYALVTVGLNRGVLDRVSRWLGRRRSSGWAGIGRAARAVDPDTALRALRGAAVTVAAVPVASYLANLLPWWRTGSPGLVVYTATLAIAALIAGLALARPWRRRLLAPVGIVAGITALVLAVDVITGARLQLAALMGVQPQVGGRFYGINNSSFALWATSTVLTAACLAEPLVRRGRRRAAALVVAVVGLVATGLNGAPGIGADFGGPPALLPAFMILALLALGVRLTWRRVLLVLGVAAVVALSFSIVDWLRPPAERSHLGRFVETVLDGGLLDVVLRKLGQNLANLFGSTLTFLAAGGIALVILVLTQPLRRAARRGDHAAYGWLAEGSSLRRLEADARMLRPALVAVAIALGIGFAVNDSGIVIPAIGISVAVPLLIGVVASWLLRLRAARPAQPVATAR
ncbi:hypothetical protein [Oceanitalea stevensii]|uniref:Uncharacterized protein n=1 Tax=Oceanitalea stevensii TaxID=2763072 RepID=A0ABR8Z3E2_9MICO|nr:hypothetical protein [Oceanitalea stevensii]MBD8062840.1 hypothetical protein [Oceanitalea stevensii]